MKSRSLVAIALSTTLLASGLASAQTVFTVSSWLPPTHTLSTSQKTWCDMLEKESAGRMKCNILPKGVVAAPGTFDAVRDGLADISYTVDGYTPGRFINTQVAEFPFLGNNAVATSVAYQRIYSKHFAPLGEHRGVKVLAVFTHGPGVIFNSKKPVTSAAARPVVAAPRHRVALDAERNAHPRRRPVAVPAASTTAPPSHAPPSRRNRPQSPQTPRPRWSPVRCWSRFATQAAARRSGRAVRARLRPAHQRLCASSR